MKHMELKGKTVLVTGSSRGLGAAIAVAFAQKGANVVLNARHEPEKIEKQIQALGVKCYFIKADIADAAAVDQMMTKITELGLQIDILVNNAGINRDKLFMQMNEDDFCKVIDTNLVGTYRVTQPLFKQMLTKRAGVIINLASVVGVHGNLGQANYAASKAGVIGLTKSIAKEGARRNVRCNAIAPGMIQSDMTKEINERRQKEIKKQIPLRRLGTPDEVAQCALFLAENDYLTGEVLTVDGGMTM